jgi:hypothetical protein
MDQQKEHLKNLEAIRSIMERSSRFISLSGLSGVFAGISALAGALAVFLYKKDFFFGRYYNGGAFLGKDLITGSELNQFITFMLVDGLLTLLLALFFGIFFTVRNAKKKGLPIWDNTTKRMLLNLFIPLVTGGVFCLILLFHHLVYLIAPVTLIFYGLALVNTSKYTLDEILYLGLCEVVLGLIATVFAGYGLIFWAIGFGILHIVYGASMYFRYERSDIKS